MLMICLVCLVLFTSCAEEQRTRKLKVDVNKTDEFTGEYEVEFDNGKIVSGKEAMRGFYNRTKNKEALYIKLTNKYTYNEEEQESATIITYDKEKYIYTNEDITKEYLYLNFSTTEEYPLASNFIRSESYCLANKESITLEMIINSWLSSILTNQIDGVVIYTDYTYKDLCFKDTKVLKIHQDSRSYEINSFNKVIAQELVDGLNWLKYEDAPDDLAFALQWKASNISINVVRKVVNDKNGIISVKDSNGYADLTYVFDFENKVVMMHYTQISSMAGTLYAIFSDENIKKAEDLFAIFQGENETNSGEYIYKDEAS